MSKARSTGNLSNAILVADTGNITFVSGSTTLATLNVTGSSTISNNLYVSSSTQATGFTATSSLYTDGGLRVGKDAYVSGTLYLNNLTVYGTQSINYITSSQLDISDNIITVNTSTPQIRFGGIAVRDSGSVDGLTGSLLWDSQTNNWLYSNPSGSGNYDSALVMMGPQNSSGLGNEVGLTLNAIPKGAGGHHMTSSAMFESSSLVGIGTSTPSTLLHLNSTRTSGTNINTLTLSDNVTGAQTAGYGLRIQYLSNNSGVKAAIGLENGNTGTNNESQISFYTQNAANALSQSMVLTSTGNLQVGTVLGGTATSTPVNISLGSTFGNNPTGSNFKLKLFEDNVPNIYGLGVSNQLLEIVAGSSGNIGFFANGSERMKITSAGNVGINTSSPTNLLHLAGASSTPSLRLASTSVGYYWDIGRENSVTGDFVFNNANGGSSTEKMRITTGGAINIKDGTLTGGGGFEFTSEAFFGARFQSNAYKFMAGNNSTEYMRVTSGGLVYIGGTSMANGQKFGIIGSGVWDGAALGLQNTGAGGNTYTIFSTNNQFSQGASNLLFYYNGGPTNNLIIYANGNYDFLGSDVSDRRLKQDIENISFGLNEIMQLSPKSYHLKSSDNLSGEHQTTLRKRHGFIAQEVQSILPDTITGTETETEYLGLDYNGVLAVAVKAIQELKAENDTLKEILQRNNIQ